MDKNLSQLALELKKIDSLVRKNHMDDVILLAEWILERREKPNISEVSEKFWSYLDTWRKTKIEIYEQAIISGSGVIEEVGELSVIDELRKIAKKGSESGYILDYFAHIDPEDIGIDEFESDCFLSEYEYRSNLYEMAFVVSFAQLPIEYKEFYNLIKNSYAYGNKIQAVILSRILFEVSVVKAAEKLGYESQKTDYMIDKLKYIFNFDRKKVNQAHSLWKKLNGFVHGDIKVENKPSQVIAKVVEIIQAAYDEVFSRGN